MALGLYQPPLPPLELPSDQEQEWVELRPRWPLTSDKHGRSTPPNRSSKAASKQARSLTDETRELLAMAAQPASGACGDGPSHAQATSAAAAPEPRSAATAASAG